MNDDIEPGGHRGDPAGQRALDMAFLAYEGAQ
jgi:hypothetical protein